MTGENMRKQEYLNQYKNIMVKISSLEEQKMSLMESMRYAKSIEYSDMPKGSRKQSDLSDYIVRLDDLIDKIDTRKLECENLRLDIEDKIVDIECGIESDILRKRYIELKSWETICIEIGYSWKQTHRYHGAALKNLKI